MYKRSVFCPFNKDNLSSLNNNTSISSLSFEITNNFEDSYNLVAADLKKHPPPSYALKETLSKWMPHNFKPSWTPLQTP
jgi:hypothetical protein